MLKKIFQPNNKFVSVTNKNDMKDINSNSMLHKCEKCKEITLQQELQKHLNVCQKCQHHYPISAMDRIIGLVDKDSFVEFDENLTSVNPLEFPDYERKLQADKEKTGLEEAIITGFGSINSNEVVLGVMEPSFRMGSMGSVVGEKITRAMEQSLEKEIPMILFCASGGARMQEGIFSLMQMAKTSAIIAKLDEKGIPFITVLTNPTTGGVSASFAMLGDIIIAEQGALIGFAGRRIIEQTIRQKLPDEFQKAEFLLEHGQVDLVVHREKLKETLSTILKIHRKGDNE